jgi:predicted secreted hydrolase
MNTENHLIKKRERPYTKIKGIRIILIVIILTAPTISIQGSATADHESSDALWKTYPYHPPGTDIIFPTDEGSHDTTTFPIEWWYANFHLTGQTTGQEYGAFVAFYRINTAIAEKQEIRIFSISDIATEKTYTNVKIGTLTACPDHLDLSFEYITENQKINNETTSQDLLKNFTPENEETTIENEHTEATMNSTSQNTMMGTMNYETTEPLDTNHDDTNGSSEESSEPTIVHYDRWYTKSNDQGLLPFQYSLTISGNSQQDDQPMKLIVDMDCLKKPLIVGGDGLIDFTHNDFSYYYGLTRLTVAGTITVHGFIENVIGTAWVDHQWGNFITKNPPQWGLTMTYEWFSIHLNDNREIVVGDIWDRETGKKSERTYTDGLNLVHSNGFAEILKNYTITPLAFWNDTDDKRIYSCQWQITEKTKSINLIITPIFLNQMMRLKENYPLLQQILENLFPGACFWEGVCTVSGTINGISVNGKSYVELIHSYDGLGK